MKALMTMQLWWTARCCPSDDERGMTTAELLGNAALGIAALVVIWGALQAMGLNVVAWMTAKVTGG